MEGYSLTPSSQSTAMSEHDMAKHPMTLEQHEKRSEKRFEKLHKGMEKIGEKVHKVHKQTKGDNHMVSENIESIGGLGGFGFGGGGGGGLLGGLLIGALLGNRGGLFGGRDGGGCERAAFDSVAGAGCTNQLLLMDKLGTIQGEIPNSALQVQNSILSQTNELSNILNQNNISQLQAASAIKDTVQNGIALSLQANSSNTQAILTAICGLGSKIDANTIAELQAELAESRANHAARGVEVNVSQNVAQVQAQAQQQQQFQALINTFGALHHDVGQRNSSCRKHPRSLIRLNR